MGSPSPLRLALAGFCLAGVAGCGHPLQNGTYAFQADGTPVQDSCGLVPDGGSLWTGILTTTGDEVFIHYNLAAPDQVRLAGFFKNPKYGAPDGFLADGTQSQLPAPVPGVPGGCPADSLVAHMDATVQDSTHLSGLLQLEYSLSPPSSGPCQDLQRCTLEAHFTAAIQP